MVFARSRGTIFRLGMGWMFMAAAPNIHAHGSHSLLLARVDAALPERPENGGLWYRRAQLDFEHEDFAESLLDLEKAGHFAPGKFPVLWLKGRSLDAAGKSNEALAALDAFIAGSPRHWEALASRARVESKLGMIEKAIADYKAALTSNPEVGLDLVQEYAQMLAGNGFTDESLRVLEDALSRLGSVPSLQMKMIEVEIAANQYDSALTRLNDFQRSAPRPEPWMEKRASLLARAGRLAESRAAWQALGDHIGQLSPVERDSHAMTLLAEQSHQALSVLASTDPPNTLR